MVSIQRQDSPLNLPSPSLSQKGTFFSFPTRNNSHHKEPSIEELIKSNLLFRNEGHLGIGDTNRFIVDYFDLPSASEMRIQSDAHGKFLLLKVKNEEINVLRPVYLTGPFSFYIDVTPYNYNRSEKFDEVIQFNSDIKPGQAFKAKLYINDNSKVKKGHYSWKIDLVSQITLTTKFVIDYTFKIGYDRKLLKYPTYDDGVTKSELILCQKICTEELWLTPPRYADKPVHLVVLTHGIFSNMGCDMLFLKDELELEISKNPCVNMIVRGFDGNVGKSEKGIRYLGQRVGDYVLDLYDKSPYHIDRISFIGHSLGGPVQAYAVFYITHRRPDFFQRVIPVNFVLMASPMLGILADFPRYVSFALDLGMLGSTGRDLTLRHKFPKLVKKSNKVSDKEYTSLTSKPTLELMLMGHTHKVYEKFLNRTTYANAINDGIVPLRTSALLYLDWRSLDQVEILKENEVEAEAGDVTDPGEPENEPICRPRKGTVGEVPENKAESKDTKEVVRHNSEDKKRAELKPSTTFLQDWKKNKKKNKAKRYLRIQTSHKSDNPNPTADGSSSVAESGKTEEVDEDDSDIEINIPPTASTILSAANVMASPSPSVDYISNPEVRPKTIFHDKYYSFDDLPKPHYCRDKGAQETDLKIRHFLGGNKKAIQERIARSWHQNMVWRKVLVTLKPDAHNNISVRRRYVNAWGWDVIDHLIENHFGKEALKKETEFVNKLQKERESPEKREK